MSGCNSCGLEHDGGIYAQGDPYGDLKRLGLPPDAATTGSWCWECKDDYNAKRAAADASVDAEFASRGLCGFLEAWIGRCLNERPCPKHAVERCWKCKAPATRNCDHTEWLVCGVPECSEHPHQHGSR